MGFFYQWGGLIGPFLAGAIFDATQSYKPTLLGIAFLYVISACLYLQLGRHRLVPGEPHPGRLHSVASHKYGYEDAGAFWLSARAR